MRAGSAWAALRARWSAQTAQWERERGLVRPTREGGWYLAVLAGVLVAAVNTGNNLLYVVLAMLMAIMIVSNLLAEWNLRSLRLRRRLPPELFAGAAASGALCVENHRRWGRSFALQIIDLDGGSGELARAVVPAVEPGGEAEAPATWRFPQRGPAGLRRLRVESRFPFGLLRRWRTFDVHEEVLVYPTLRRGLSPERGGAPFGARPDPQGRGGDGDLVGLREYSPGDPLRDLHWLTSARVGRPVVVIREALRRVEVIVRVPPVEGEALERALSEAAMEIVRHTAEGHAVGLELGAERRPARVGERWRRALLDALARFPGGAR